MKEWLCLTCQMQRALTASESVQPPLMKAQASPSKVSSPNAAAKPKTDTIPTPKEEVPDKKHQESTSASKEEIQLNIKEKPGSVSVQKQDDKTGLPPAKEIQNITASDVKETTKVVSDVNKPLAPQASSVDTIKTLPLKEMDGTLPGPPASKEVPDKKEDQVEKNLNLAKDEVKSQQDKQLKLTETLGSAALPTGGSPKSPRAASKTTEAVTGKMLGFGSSLFSSASTLITSAVQESRTPPTSRKMSAPAQVSDKMSTSEVSPKPSPPVSPRMTSTKETKPAAGQKPLMEKIQDQPQQAKPSPSEQDRTADRETAKPARNEDSLAAPKVGKSTCPLCKADLNTGSEDPPNYNSCTGCKMTVCNKCGFSPMPSVKEVIQ